MRSHLQSRSITYSSWRSMKRRCFEPSHPSYANYGGRGITVDPSWIDSFENFLRDVGERPSRGHSLERIDPDGNYTKDNCTWATATEQSRNRRSNMMITIGGETKALSAWCEEFDTSFFMVYQRIRRGWPAELALKTPKGVVPVSLEEDRVVDEMELLKTNARGAVNYALSVGKLIKPSVCESEGCSVSKIEAHHHLGYDKENWLSVRWLCRQHHTQVDT